jgi:hypothetical protein
MTDKLIVWGLLLIFPGSIVLAVLSFNIYTAIEWNRTDRLQQSGLSTQGTIVSLDQMRSLKTPTTYHVTYQYRLQNRDYITQRQVDGNLYRQLSLNKTAPVLYFGDRPEKSDLSGNHARENLLGFAIALDVALLGFFLSVVKMAKDAS